MNPTDIEWDEPASRLSFTVDGTAADERADIEWDENLPLAPGALESDPDKVARARAVAGATGLPSSVVEAEPDAAEERLRREQIEQATAADPALARTMANPEVARIAHDDVEQLSLIGQIVRSFEYAGRAIAAGLPAAASGLWGATRGALETSRDAPWWMPFRLLGPDMGQYEPLVAVAERGAVVTDEMAKDWRPDAVGMLGAAYSGLESFGQILALLPAGGGAMTSALSIISGGNAYTQGREEGLSAADAARHGFRQGLIEYVTERAPSAYAEKMFKGPATEIVDSLKRWFVSDGIGEQFATLFQDFDSWVSLPSNADKTFDQFLDERGPAAIDTMIASIVTGGALGTTAHSFAALRERRAEQQAKAARATENADIAAKLLGESAASRLRARDAEAFARHLEDATTDGAGNVAEVFIDAEQFQQAVGPQVLAQLQETAPAIAEQIAEAIELGGDVRLPVADFVTAFAGTPAGEALAQHVRRGADEMSAAEAVVFASMDQETFRQEMERAVERATAQIEASADRNTVFARMLERLTTAGRFTEDVNRVQAMIPAAIIQTMAARQGLSAQEFADQWLPNVRTENPAQPGSLLNATDEPQFRAWFGGSKAVEMVAGSGSRDARFAPQRMYHTTRNSFDAFEVGRPATNSTTFGDVETTRNAVFVTPDAGASGAYGMQGGAPAEGANTLPVYVRVENPLDLTEGLTGQDEARLLAAGVDSRFMHNRLGHWEVFDGEEGKELVGVLKAAGYDGVVFNDENPDTGESFESWAVFDPEQIKSVFNRGTWSPASANVLEQRAPSSRFNVRREKKTGRYVGAPDWVGSSPQALGALRRNLRQLATEGAAGRFWYEDSARAVMELVGGDKAEAEKFIALLAIYSQGTEVTVNVNFALTAYYQWKAGLPINTGRFPSSQSPKAEALLRRNEGWGGVKTNNFYNDLMEEIDPSKMDEEHATMDMWMALAFDYGTDQLDQGPKYKFAKAIIGDLAEEMGVRPHQAQAMVWTAIKHRVESTAKQRRTVERKRGIQVQAEDGTWSVPKDKQYEHFRLAFKLAMQAPLDQAAMDASKHDFGDALREYMIQLSWEATPSTKPGRSLPGIHGASLEQKFEYLAAMRRALSDENGRDLIADLVGLPQGVTHEGVSAWEGQVGAGAQTLLAAPLVGMKAARTIRDVPRQLLDLYAAALGFVLEQDAVVYHAPIWDDSRARHNGVHLSTIRPLHVQEVEMLYGALAAKFGTQELAPAWRPDGVRVLNFVDGLDNVAFLKGFEEVVESLPEDFAGGGLTHTSFRSEGNYVGNNWEASPNGEEYLRRIEAGRPDILGGLANLRARAEAVNREFAARYGWDRPAAESGSYAQSARDGGAVRAATPYGVGPATGVHFSHQRRSVLDGRYYGTGIRGREAERVLSADDARLKERVYFYLDTGRGVRREAGLGVFAHEVDLPDLYDGDNDPLSLGALQGNDFESAVLDAGFAGYFTREVGSGNGVAVVIGAASRELRTRAIEAQEQATAANAAPARYTTLLRSAVADAITQEQLATVRAVAPSARLRGLSFAVDAAELPAAREALAKIGVELPERSLEQAAFHGSPHVFERFDLSKIGSGEGAQAYGWGLYFADARGVAQDYREKLAERTEYYTIDGKRVERGAYGTVDHIVLTALSADNAYHARKLAGDYRRIGNGEKADAILARLDELAGRKVVAHEEKGGALLKVDIPDEATGRMLLWDATLDEQPEMVRAALLSVDRPRVEANKRYRAAIKADAPDDVLDALHAQLPEAGPLAALSGNITGRHVYSLLSRELGSDRAASEYLGSLGIPGLRYLDQGSRAKGGGTYNTVVWDQATIDQINESVEHELAQRKDAPRGTYSPSTNTIALLEQANLSTFLHEVGHWGLEVLTEAAVQPGAPRQIVDDALTLLAFGGVPDLQTWQGLSLDQRRAAHEKIAEGFETYLFEGKAPSVELQGAFSRIAQWMKDVYRQLTGMRVQLTDEVRGVFDRMLATDEQIAEQSRVRAMAPLFASAAEAGVSAADWQAYQATGAQAAMDAVDDLRSRSLRDMKWLSNAKGRELSRLQRAAKDVRKSVRAEVAAEVDAQPVYAALRFIARGEADERGLTNAERRALDTIAGGKTKLDLQYLKDFYGDSWPVLATRLLPLTAAEGGAHPDAVATAFGFDSGDALVRAILAAEPRESLIEGMTDRRMLEEHAELSDPQALERAAEAAIHNAARTRFVATEYKFLADALNPREQTGETVVRSGRNRGQVRAITVNGLVRAANQYAEQIVGRTVVRKLSAATHARAAAKAATAARAAMAAGDTAKALTFKRNQLLHERTSRAIGDARVEAERAVHYLRKFRNSNRARGSIDADYVEAIENLLVAIDTRTVTNRRLESLESLRKWKAAQEAEGLPVALDPDLIASLQVQNVRDMTMEQLRGLVDQVKTIEHLGKLKKKLLTARDKREFDAIVESLAESIREHGGEKRQVPLEVAAAKHDFGRWLREAAAEHRKIASFARQMDGGQDDGAFYRALIRGMDDAGNRETSLVHNSTRALAAIFKPLEKMKGGLTGDLRLIPSIGESLSRGGRIAVALNYGNELNRQRLLNTFPQEAIDEIFATITAEEWDAIEAVWAHVNEYWPDIAAKEKRVTGVTLEKVEAAPFIVRVDGQEREIAGGYYPIVYESEVSDVASAHEEAQTAKDMLAGAYGRKTSRRGHTKRRAEKVGEPLRLSLDVIERHLSQVIHDLAWHEWLIDANRLLHDKRISTVVREHYGNETLKAMRKTVNDIATGDLVMQGRMAKIVGSMRARVSVAVMGWSLTTALLQPFGLFQSIPRVGGKWILRGMAHWAGDTARFENSARLIREKSVMMEHRSTTFNRDIREITARIHRGKGTAQEVFEGSMFILMQKLQLVADIPTWWGAYEKALFENPHDEGRAVALADRAVLDAQGGGTIKDLAGVQRGGELMKAISMFYSYFSATHQIAVESTSKTNFRNPAQVAGWLADMVMLSVVPVLAQQLVFGLVRTTGADDDDDKELGDRLVDFGKEFLAFWMNTVIVLREFSGAVQGFNYSGPAAFRAIVEAGNLAKAAPKALDPDEELEENDYRRAIKSVLTVLGWPAAQVDRSWRGWRAWEEGEAGPGAVLLGPPPREQ